MEQDYDTPYENLQAEQELQDMLDRYEAQTDRESEDDER